MSDFSDSDIDRAKELGVYLNITTQRWRRTQYEVVDAALIRAAIDYLLDNQNAKVVL